MCLWWRPPRCSVRRRQQFDKSTTTHNAVDHSPLSWPNRWQTCRSAKVCNAHQIEYHLAINFTSKISQCARSNMFINIDVNCDDLIVGRRGRFNFALPTMAWHKYVLRKWWVIKQEPTATYHTSDRNQFQLTHHFSVIGDSFIPYTHRSFSQKIGHHTDYGSSSYWSFQLSNWHTTNCNWIYDKREWERNTLPRADAADVDPSPRSNPVCSLGIWPI